MSSAQTPHPGPFASTPSASRYATDAAHATALAVRTALRAGAGPTLRRRQRFIAATQADPDAVADQ